MAPYQDLERIIVCALAGAGQATASAFRNMIQTEIAVHEQSISILQQSISQDYIAPIYSTDIQKQKLEESIVCVMEGIGKTSGELFRNYQLLKISQHERSIQELRAFMEKLHH